MKRFLEATGIDKGNFVKGQGHRKSIEQKQYQKLEEYLDRLKKYAKHIEICGENRNSYSKTDHDATFMRVKKDYMPSFWAVFYSPFHFLGWKDIE